MKPHELPGNNKYFFYIKQKYFNLQLTYYKLFVIKHGIPVETLVECLEELRIITKSKTRTKLFAMMEFYFEDLLKGLTAKTGKKFKKRPSKHRNGYNEWYAEASMDGSLAYNGVTDDF